MTIAAILVFVAVPMAIAQVGPAPVTPEFPKRVVVHLNGACRQDRLRFCSGVTPGEGRLIDCYDIHKAQLSKACLDVVGLAIWGRELVKKQQAYLAAKNAAARNAPAKAPPAQSPATPARTHSGSQSSP